MDVLNRFSLFILQMLKQVPFSKSNDENQDKLLLEPMLYLLQVPGKNVRKKLLSSFNIWTKVAPEKVLAIGELVQMLHNASLLLDDIEDNSILRYKNFLTRTQCNFFISTTSW